MGASNAIYLVDMDVSKDELLTWRSGMRPSAELVQRMVADVPSRHKT